MKYFLLSLFLFQSLILSASDKWQHIFGGTADDAVSKIINANGGGWITAGYTSSYGDSGYNVLIVKWNTDGKMVWQKVIGNNADEYGYSAVQDSTGNIYVAGKTNGQGTAGGFDVDLLKLDSSGTLIWQHTYGGSGDDYANAVIIDSAGDIVMAGGTTSFGSGGSDVYLVKVNSSGSLLWSKTFGNAGDEYAKSLAHVSGGGYILVGQTTSSPGNYGYVVKTNGLGDSLWTKVYNVGGTNLAMISDVAELSDSEYIYTGLGNISSYVNMFHMKTDLNGNLQYIHFSTHLDDAGYSIVKTFEGGYAITGFYGNYGWFPILTKFSSSGIMQWEHIYEYNLSYTYNSFAEAESMVQNADGSFTLGGSSGLNSSCGDYENGMDGFVMKTDSDGCSVPTLTQPITANPGTNFCDSASVNVTLTAPSGYLSYQWFHLDFCTEKINGATSQTYNVTQAGIYLCLLISDDGIYYSNEANITVRLITNPPIVTPSGIVNKCILSMPYDGELSTTDVTGLNYQWLLNGISIPGATDSYYLPVADGLYSVTIFNNCGSQTSVATEMHLNQGPQNVSISTNGQTYVCHRSGQFAYLLSSETDWRYIYTWLLNNSPISGTSNSYDYSPSVSGNYSLIVNNDCGVDTSNIITIHVDSNSVPVINSIGNSNLTVFSGSGINYYCGSEVLYCPISFNYASYEWRLNGNILTGNSSNCTAQQPGSYTVTIIDSCGTSVPSQPYIVNAIQGNDSLVVLNNNSCDYALLSAPWTTNYSSYQWYMNGATIFHNGPQLNTTSAGNFYCTFQPAICPMIIPTNTVSLNASAGYAWITASPSTNVCSGNILLSMNDSNATYIWKKNGVIISGATHQTYSASQTGSYTCIISRPGCSQDSTQISIAIGTNRIIADHQIVCPNNSTRISLQAYDYSSSFQWRRNGVDLIGDTDYYFYATQPGTYNLRIAGSCGTYLTNSVTLTSPSTTISPSGIVHLCEGSVASFSAPIGSGYKYEWSYNNSFFSGDTNSTFSITTNTICCGTWYLQVQIIIPGVCSYYTEADTIIPDILLSNNIYPSTPAEWCGNGNVQLNARVYSGYSYQWYKNLVAIPSATASNYIASSTGNYYVSIGDSIGCTNNSNAIPVRKNQLDGTISVNGCQTLCAGSSIPITLISTANTFQWYLDGDSIIGATVMNHLGDTTGIYSVSFSNSSGCTGSSSITISVAPYITDHIISPGQNHCIGDTIVLRSSSYYDKQWYLNGVAIAGQTDYQCSVYQTGLYSEILNQNGCPVSSDTVALNFDSIPSASITSNNTSLCIASYITLTANQGANHIYQWKKNGVNLSGATFINYTATSTGVYTCEVTSNCGTTLSNLISITSSFNATLNASGATTFCGGGSVSLNAMPSTGGYFYQWKNNNTNIPGANSNVYTANTSGNYFVEISDSNGCVNSSNIITVDVIPNSPSPSLTSPSGYVCPGRNIILSVNAAHLISYQWKRNGVNIPGAVSSAYAATSAGIYTCRVANNCGTGISDSVFITISPLPVINLVADTALCLGTTITLDAGWAYGNSYLWQDSSSSELLTLTSVIPDSNLVYVTVTNSNGCSSSDTALVNFEICAGINPVSKNETFFIYPNPAIDKITIYASIDNNFTIKIIDLTGRSMFSQKVSGNRTEINTSLFAAGIYFIQFKTSTGSYLRKFVKE